MVEIGNRRLDKFELKPPPKPLPLNKISKIEKYLFYALLGVVAVTLVVYFLLGNSKIAISVMLIGIIMAFGIGMYSSKRVYKSAEIDVSLKRKKRVAS